MYSGNLPQIQGQNTPNVERQFNNQIIQQRSDGFFDATMMCQATGKHWHDYFRLDTTQEFLTALSQSLETPIESQNGNSRFGEFKGLIEVIKGGNFAGTYVNPYVAINLAQWCSPEFAVQVSKWVFELMSTGEVSLDIQSPIDYERLAKISTQARKTYRNLGLTGKILNDAVHKALIEQTGIDPLVQISSNTSNLTPLPPYEPQDEFERKVIEFVKDLKEVTTKQVLTSLGFENNKAGQMKVANLLKHVGWQYPIRKRTPQGQIRLYQRQSGKTLPMYPILWLGTSILISVVLHFVLGGMQ